VWQSRERCRQKTTDDFLLAHYCFCRKVLIGSLILYYYHYICWAVVDGVAEWQCPDHLLLQLTNESSSFGHSGTGKQRETISQLNQNNR